MDTHVLKRLQETLNLYATRNASHSPIFGALAAGLAAGPSPAAADLFSRFFRMASVTQPDVPLFLSGLHHLALTGAAPGLAAFLPSCGGAFRPGAEEAALVAAAEEALSDCREELLDYLLSHELQPHAVERSTAVMLGAWAAADRFGGGVCLVEAGAAGGLNLLFDRYAYQFGSARLGESPLVLPVAAEGLPSDLVVSPVVGRYGLDLAPRDLTDEAEVAVLSSFFPPDRPELVAHLRTATALMAEGPRPDLRQGTAEGDLYPLLAEAYNGMAPGNTLLLVDTFLWPYMSDPQRQDMTYSVQHLAAQLLPRKPLAWVQLEPAGPAGTVELKLHTFGWADREDRAVRRLAETDAYATRIRWLEG